MLALVMTPFAACNGLTDEAPTVEGGGLPCEVERIVRDACWECHGTTPLYGAPMSLLAASDFHRKSVTKPAERVYERVLARTHDANARMPPPPKKPLGASDLAVLDGWIAGGARASSAACPAPLTEAGTKDREAPPITNLPPGCPNLTLKAAAPYVMPETVPDQYVCYGVDLALPKKRHVTAFTPKIDNAVITHHAIVYLSPYAESGTPHVCGGGGAVGQRMIYGWAPGGGPFELPKEAGLPLEGTVHLVVQMHYSNLKKLADQSDQSSIELCTTDELRPNDADVIAFGSTTFQLPPRASHRVDCTLDIPANVPELTVFRSMPHMHTLGRSIGSVRERAGVPTPIDEVTAFNFGAQAWNDVSASLKGGDKVHTYCAWTNAGDTPVFFGEKTSDEMCYHFVMAYPRITAPGWSWDAPVSLADCK